MARKTKHEQNKEKAAKQKKIAIGGGVLLVALLAIQVPRTMKMMNGHAKPPVVSTTAADGTTTTTAAAPADPNSLAAPTLAGSPTETTTTTSSNLVASVPLEVDAGQLENFQRFASKDPFASQAPTAGAPSGSSGSSSSKPKGTAGTSAGGGSGTTTVSKPSTTPAPPAPPAPAPTAGVISLNGVLMSVGVNTDFPSTTPVFHLISLTASTAKLGIAGGSYSDGSQAITLKLKTPVTLQNTADGTKYTLILEPASTPVTAPAAPSSAPPATTTPASVPAVPSGSGG